MMKKVISKKVKILWFRKIRNVEYYRNCKINCEKN